MTSDQTPLTNRPAYDRPDRRQRWLAIRNTGSTEIPGYGVCQLVRSQGNYFFTTAKREQQAVFLVQVPADDNFNPSMVVFNGPTPIPAGGYGRGTQDLPAQVLHDGASDSLPNGSPCGIKVGSPYLWSTGFGFTCMSHDACVPVGTGDVHTIWVGPADPTVATLAQFSAFGGGTSIAAGDKLPIYSVSSSYGAEVASSNDGIKITRAGLWHITVAATLSSTDTPRGGVLRMRLYNGASSTVFQGFRLNDIEEGEYGDVLLYTQENVAFSGIVDVTLNDELSLKNGGSYAANYSSLIVTGIRISSEVVDNSLGSLIYP